MADFGPRFGDDDQGTLSFRRKGRRLVEVFFEPSKTRLEIAGLGETDGRVLLLQFDAQEATTTLFPINTMPGSEEFLQPKHDPIRSIELVEDAEYFDDYNAFKTLDDVQAYLQEGMPKGFIKDPNYGLGLDRKLSFLLSAIGSIEGVTNLRLTPHRDLDVGLEDAGVTYEMGYRLFDHLRRQANLFDTKARTSAHKKKIQLAYTNIKTALDREKFPVRIFDRSPDDIAEAIGDTIADARLSEKDRAAVVGMAAASVRTSMKSQRGGLVKLHDEIELASLDELISHMEERFAERTTELQWQKLFETNPFILDMAFNVPVLLVQGQAHVGGKILDGSGEKIVDFLFANKLTDSMAVLEIKTPTAELIGNREYRAGVYGPSGELVGAVAQVLDQIDKVRSNIYQIQATHRQQRLEAYGIKGMILAGMMPEGTRKRAFELYRGSLSGVTIITFDELLTKLKSLRDLLEGKTGLVASGEPKAADQFEALF